MDPGRDNLFRRILTLPGLMLLVWLRPRRAGRHVAGRRLGSALLVHLLGLLLSAAGVLLMQWLLTVRRRGAMDLSDMAGTFTSLLQGYLGSYVGAGAAVAAGVTMLLFELYYWAFGIGVLGSWMAPPGTVGRYYYRGAIVTGYATLYLPLAAMGWWAVMLRYAGAGRPTQPTMAVINAAAMGACLSVIPALAVAMAMRLAGGMGKALGQPAPAEDPVCERCGYNLHATDYDRSCPECGTPAALSLSSIHRTSAWETHRSGYCKALALAIFHPGGLFRRVTVRSRSAPARRFFATTTTLSSIIFSLFCGLAYAGYLLGNPGNWPVEIDRVLIQRMAFFATLGGGIWALLVMLGSMIAVNMLATGSRKRRDNLGRIGSLKIGCYLSALSIPWAILCGVALCITYAVRGLPSYSRTYDPTMTLAWAILGVMLLIWYWLAGSRAYEACHFANR